MNKIPQKYKHILNSNMPMVIKEAVNLYGIYEHAGTANNPVILEWAKEVGPRLGIPYTADSIPWCGLFVAICVKRAGFEVPNIAVRASEWSKFGNPIWIDDAMVGDVLVFTRSGGGHVGFYVGEDDSHFHVLGGNQSDQVNIVRIARNRCMAVRRCPWRVAEPKGVRKMRLSASGNVSENEA